jgi:hypothetical protein
MGDASLPTPLSAAEGIDAMPAPQPPRPRRRLRNYLIDPRFQLRYTATLVGASMVVLGALGLVVGRTAETAAQEARGAVELATVAVEQADRAFHESQTAAHALRLQRLAANADDPALARALEDELQQIDARARADFARVQAQRARAGAQRARIEASGARTRRGLLLGGGLFVLFLTALGIAFTHRVVGPVYRLKQLCWKVGRGDLEIKERLRQGDELQDLYEAFLTMVAALRANQAREVAALEIVLKKLETEKCDETSLKGLQTVIHRMRAGMAPSEEDTRPSQTPG